MTTPPPDTRIHESHRKPAENRITKLFLLQLDGGIDKMARNLRCLVLSAGTAAP